MEFCLMNILVTGAAGRLGRVVAADLAAHGHTVRGTDHRFEGGLAVPVVPADLLDEHACYRLIEGCDTLVHLANHPNMNKGVSPQRLYRENVTMNVHIVQAALDMGVRRIVFASSIQAIAGRRNGSDASKPSELPYLPLDGDLPARPGNLYALSKVAGESLLKMHCYHLPELSATAIRFPALLEAEWMEHRQNRPRRRRPSTWSNGDEGFAYLLFENAAALVRAVVERQTPGYHQYLPAEPNNSLAWPIEDIIRTYYAEVPRRNPGQPLTTLVDTSRITDALGWRPTHVLEPAAADPDLVESR
jgi:nucleoside-diphosphate-sugar epimerase